MRIFGIDPGVSGGIACIPGNSVAFGSVPFDCLKLKDATERDIFDWLLLRCEHRSHAFIEKVASSPQMGVVSAFTFGRGYGFLRGILIASQIPFEEVTPRTWQKEMACLSGGDKNVTKQRAQQLFPNVKCTHSNSDALLIAEYGRRVLNIRQGASECA